MFFLRPFSTLLATMLMALLLAAGGPPAGARGERLLPLKRNGYYTEYTVPTPSSRDREARRIIAGGDPANSDELYYTEDHYASFRKIRDPMQ